MKQFVNVIVIGLFLAVSASPTLAGEAVAKKPSPDQCISILKEGNVRFVQGKAENPHSDTARLIQAGKENQGDHAYATVITCSDSRVPVERVFDAGVMDIFVIRVTVVSL